MRGEAQRVQAEPHDSESSSRKRRTRSGRRTTDPPKRTAFLHVRDEHPGSDSHSSTKGKKRGRHFNSEGQDAPGTQRVAKRNYRDVT